MMFHLRNVIFVPKIKKMKQLFPREVIENSRDVHHARYSKKQQWIYLFIALAICIALSSLPFIKVSIYTNSNGIVQSEKERIILKTPYTGRVVKQYLVPNGEVQKGDTLVVLDNHTLENRERNILAQKEDIEMFMSDISKLLEDVEQPQSSKYQQEFLLYQEKLEELQTRLGKAKNDFDTDLALYEKDIISRVDFENTQLKYNLAKSNLLQLEKQQMSNWQTQIASYKEKLRKLDSELSEIRSNKKFMLIKAPVSGTMVSVAGVNAGSTVVQGMQLAELSPQTALCVVCYISPQDIGFLRKDNPVKFQVAAFNYNQWGVATGKVLSIGNDVQLINNSPMFRVQCSLDQPSLYLKGGFEGRLKKGMTLTAHFKLTERTLFQLLYDKVDDWVNPNTSK